MKTTQPIREQFIKICGTGAGGGPAAPNGGSLHQMHEMENPDKLLLGPKNRNVWSEKLVRKTCVRKKQPRIWRDYYLSRLN